MLRLTLFLIALAAGGLAAWLTISMQGGNAPAAPVAAAPVEPAMRVLVAAADIDSGATLEASNLEWQDWPQGALNPAYITRTAQPDAITELEGSILRRALAQGEPMREDSLTGPGDGLLSAALPSGKRAIAIRISAESTAGGFILPHDRVDVLHTRANQAAESGGLTRTLLRNVRVLAIDQRAEESAQEEGSGSVVGKTATLELDPDQAEKITAAESTGLLSLALRSTADNSETQAVEASNRTIRIYRSGQAETVQVQ